MIGRTTAKIAAYERTTRIPSVDAAVCTSGPASCLSEKSYIDEVVRLPPRARRDGDMGHQLRRDRLGPARIPAARVRVPAVFLLRHARGPLHQEAGDAVAIPRGLRCPAR